MIIQANSFRIGLKDNSVHCAISSFPYWGLRSYGLPNVVFGGQSDCSHEWGATQDPHKRGQVEQTKWKNADGAGNGQNATTGQFCQLCGGWLGSFGLEPTMTLHVQNAVIVSREIRRVLHPMGTFWLNYGDSYATGKNGRSAADGKATGSDDRTFRDKPFSTAGEVSEKNLCLIPQRVAIALQEDGWILRAAPPWIKRNAMPESVQDRPGNAHEYVFMFTKGKKYYYDIERARRGKAESTMKDPRSNGNGHRRDRDYPGSANNGGTNLGDPAGGRSLRTSDFFFDSLDSYIAHLQAIRDNGGMLLDSTGMPDAFVVNPTPYRFAHFACVDEETECLTPDGWKTHGELNCDDDLIASFDLFDKRLSWQKIKTIHKYQVENQDMVSVGERDLSMLVTPNHRTVIRKREAGKTISDDYYVIRADEINGRNYIPVAAPWGDAFHILAENLTSLRLAELCGWYVTEGYAIGANRIGIDQSIAVNPEKVERIRKLLTDLNVDFCEYLIKRTWQGRTADMVKFKLKGWIVENLRQVCPDKCLPVDCLEWSHQRLESLLVGIMLGDGSIRKDDGRMSVIQKSKKFIDTVQAIAIRLGYTAVINQRKDGAWTCNITKRPYRSVRATNGIGTTISTEKYSGIVWCPETTLTTFVARRRGRVFITGNTFPPALVAPMIQASTSEKGVCPKCGAPWLRQVERTAMVIKRSDRQEQMGEFGRTQSSGTMVSPASSKTTGWQPSCKCKHVSPVAAIVLDPFAGSGTVGQVCNELGRRFIGLDLNPRYLAENALPRAERLTSMATLETLPMFGGAI